MRHGKKIIKLGRKSAHRKAMLGNMAVSLFEHKRITTTSTKAKALKIFVEPLITKSKNDTVHNRRICFSKLRNPPRACSWRHTPNTYRIRLYTAKGSCLLQLP